VSAAVAQLTAPQRAAFSHLCAMSHNRKRVYTDAEALERAIKYSTKTKNQPTA
jgi:hypothetical protein